MNMALSLIYYVTYNLDDILLILEYYFYATEKFTIILTFKKI